MWPSRCRTTNKAWRSMTEPYHWLMAKEWLKLLIGARGAKRNEIGKWREPAIKSEIFRNRPHLTRSGVQKYLVLIRQAS